MGSDTIEFTALFIPITVCESDGYPVDGILVYSAYADVHCSGGLVHVLG